MGEERTGGMGKEGTGKEGREKGRELKGGRKWEGRGRGREMPPLMQIPGSAPALRLRLLHIFKNEVQHISSADNFTAVNNVFINVFCCKL